MSYPSPGLLPCPYCECPMECDSVDIGIGYQQCGPYYCDLCGASEMGPEFVQPRAPRPLTRKQQEWLDSVTEEEYKTHFYKGHRHSPYANTINGELVSHGVAKGAYRMGILDDKDIP